MTRQINAAGQFGPSTLTVSSNANEASYTTIQEAVTAASANDTIYIFPGTYTESIAWPADLSVEGASNGEETFSVIIDGLQTFAGNGSLSFKDIQFQSTGAGDVFTQTATSGNGILEFDDCKFITTAGSLKGIVSSSTGTSTSKLFIRSCDISSVQECVSITGLAGFSAEATISDTRLLSGDNNNTIQVNDYVTMRIEGSAVDASPIPALTNSNIVVSGANSSVSSFNNTYNSFKEAFSFTANGNIRSVQDDMFNMPTYWAGTGGAGIGNLVYGSTVIDTTASSSLDPNITASTVLQTLTSTSGASITWSDQGASTTVGVNTGSVSTAAITLTLPASPSNGDICEFILGAAANLNITAGAGQKVRIGNAETAIAGTVSTGVLGNSLKLVYNTTLTTWLSTSLIGNWVV